MTVIMSTDQVLIVDAIVIAENHHEISYFPTALINEMATSIAATTMAL